MSQFTSTIIRDPKLRCFERPLDATSTQIPTNKETLLSVRKCN